MKSIGAGVEVYLWLGVADMRAGFDRLSHFVQEHVKRSVISGGVYVFLSRCRRKVKLLYWDLDGYAIWYKRLEAGALKVEKREGVFQVTAIDLEELLRGLDLSRIILRKNAEKGLYSLDETHK